MGSARRVRAREPARRRRSSVLPGGCHPTPSTINILKDVLRKEALKEPGPREHDPPQQCPAKPHQLVLREHLAPSQIDRLLPPLHHAVGDLPIRLLRLGDELSFQCFPGRVSSSLLLVLRCTGCRQPRVVVRFGIVSLRRSDNSCLLPRYGIKSTLITRMNSRR